MPAPAGIDVSILIVSYNTRELTLAALASAAAETRNCSFEIIVVDNNSHDGSAAAIAAHPAKPHLVALDENIGFARANNLAAEHARGEYVLLLNPDTVVLDGAIDKLVAFARANKEALIWGGRTLFADGSLNPASAWGRMTPWRLVCRAAGLTGLFPRSSMFNGEAIGGWARDTERAVDIVSGCFFLMPRSVWTALGGFDPAFFMYGEEADLCARAARIGARPRVTPAATIVHLGGASETVRADKMVRLLAAKATLIDRHWMALLKPAGLWLNALWPFTRSLAFGLARRITGREQHALEARTWREVWERRLEWRYGYPRPRLTAAERHAQSPLLPGFGTAA